MTYTKQDALMTKGMAILFMVILHLFFRERSVVLGTPLLWFNEDIPVIYWLGFYGEICVTVYCLCIGYAQYMLYKDGKATWILTSRRVFRILVNYWIILVIFCFAGLLYTAQTNIPGSLSEFIKNVFLFHRYNTAWWFLNSYILFLLIPPRIKFFITEKMSVRNGIILSLIASVLFYLIKKAGVWAAVPSEYTILTFVTKEIQNLLSILPPIWIGSFFYKGNIMQRVYNSYYGRFSNKKTAKSMLAIIWIIQLIIMNLLHKSVLNIIFGTLAFVQFNIWNKGEITKKVFMFLGKHSTNIWLSHVFFYMTLFTGLVQSAKYPLFILIFTLVLSIATSYLVIGIERILYGLFRGKSTAFN